MKTLGVGWTTVLVGLLALRLQPATTDASCHTGILTYWANHTMKAQWKTTFEHKLRHDQSTVIVCENITDSSDLPLTEQSLQELSSPGHKFGIFFIRCNLDVLPANFLSSTEVSHLAFYKCNMSDIPYDLINSLRDTLSLFWIIDSSVQSRTISGGRFRYNRNMKHVGFIKSGIESVEGSPFCGLYNLIILDITSNNISSIDKGAFDCLINLKELYIHSNEIRSLDKELFIDLTNLEFLMIQGNRLTTLSEGIFEPLIKLNTLYLGGNNLHCNCDLQWLQDWFQCARLKDPNFSESATCHTPMEGDLMKLNFCNNSRPAKKTTKKTVPSDCSLNKLSDDQTWFNHVGTFLLFILRIL